MTRQRLSLPQAVRDAIETRDGAPIGARNARPENCPRCKAPTLVGLDGERLAMTIRADPIALSAEGETTGLDIGRKTYTLTRTTSGRWQIDWRPSWRRSHMPATVGALYDVVATHFCGNPIPDAYQQPSNLT